jgi:hypothetical protein
MPNPTGWEDAPYAGSSWVTNRDAGIAAHQLLRHRFGAIAYSASTGRFGWSFGQDDEATAEQMALGYCEAPDAAIVVWGEDSFIALALGDDGTFGWAWGGKQEEVAARAIASCPGANARLVVLIHSRNGPS